MSTTTTAELAYRSVRQMLVDGHLRAGQRISQLRLARELRCSKVPIVEALRRLESEGLLVKEGRKMAKVRVLLEAEVEGLYYVRQAMEMSAARLCAKRILRDEIEKLQDLSQRFEHVASQRSAKEADQLDMEIHHFIVRCARCPLLEQELDRLMLINRTVPGCLIDPADWQRYTLSHRAIVEAITHRDPESAEFLMKKHIEHGYEEAVQRVQMATKDSKS